MVARWCGARNQIIVSKGSPREVNIDNIELWPLNFNPYAKSLDPTTVFGRKRYAIGWTRGAGRRVLTMFSIFWQLDI